MKFTVKAAKATDLASNIRLLNKMIDESISDLQRIATEIDNEGDEVLSEKGYGKNLIMTSQFMQVRYENIERIAAALDWLVSTGSSYENDALKALKDKTLE